MLRRLRDPYNLPCGHTFCLRPCLLPHAKAVTSRCVHCDETFNASQLRPNYTIGARLYLLSSRPKQEQKKEQKQEPKQQVGDKDECAKDVSNEGKETSEKPCILIACSTCRRAVDSKVLGVCHHCYRNICPQCREKHHESVRLSIFWIVPHNIYLPYFLLTFAALQAGSTVGGNARNIVGSSSKTFTIRLIVVVVRFGWTVFIER